MDDISPEERLFNVIKEGNAPAAKKMGIEGKPSEQNKGTAGCVLKWQEGARDRFFKICSSGKNCLSDIDIEAAGKILMVICGALVIFLLADFIRLTPNIKRVYKKISAQPASGLKKKTVTLLDPLSAYLNAAAKRDIFSPLSSSKAAQAEIGAVAAAEAIKDLSLVGIYWGEIPEAMIEDTEEKKTYFLKVGQHIRGLKVEAIFEDRIILEYDNQTVELM